MNNKLKEVRENKGMSQEELSQRSGVSRTTISKIENWKEGDRIILKTSTIIDIAKALDSRIEDIFFANKV